MNRTKSGFVSIAQPSSIHDKSTIKSIKQSQISMQKDTLRIIEENKKLQQIINEVCQIFKVKGFQQVKEYLQNQELQQKDNIATIKDQEQKIKQLKEKIELLKNRQIYLEELNSKLNQYFQAPNTVVELHQQIDLTSKILMGQRSLIQENRDNIKDQNHKISLKKKELQGKVSVAANTTEAAVSAVFTVGKSLHE